ncbi:MAG TPA: LysR family transcriptional regulator [Bryobacteraceae bacterium]|nr:LysR family transcriptional regulator [Bryobacteraceae bacterium]
MNNVDLKLLTIVAELFRTRSVSQTAENLALSQSTVSMHLATLRKHFNDPLFVKTSSGMEPTPHMAELLEPIQKSKEILESILEHHVVFNPATSDRMFRVCSTDIAKITMMPKLLKRLQAVAPSIRVELRGMSANTARLLESGEVDLAVGFLSELGAGFCEQKLFEENFVCVVRTDHPRVKSTLTLAQFASEIHLAVTTSGTGHDILERTLEAEGIDRKIVMRVDGFLGIASIIEATDCLVVVPQQLGNYLTKQGRIKMLALPFEVPNYFVMQHWHERYTHDAANEWLRGLFAELFASGKAHR